MSGVRFQGKHEEIAKSLNRLAREQMKKRLLQDVLIDLKVCEIEGYDKKQYIKEIIDMMKGIDCGN